MSKVAVLAGAAWELTCIAGRLILWAALVAAVGDLAGTPQTLGVLAVAVAAVVFDRIVWRGYGYE